MNNRPWMAIGCLKASLAKPDLTPLCRQTLERRLRQLEARIKERERTFHKSLKERHSYWAKKGAEKRISNIRMRHVEMIPFIRSMREEDGMTFDDIAVELAKKGYRSLCDTPYTSAWIGHLYRRSVRMR